MDATPLAAAVADNDLAEAARLLADGAETDALAMGNGRDAQTPLTVALSRGFSEAVRLLLENRADPNFPDARGYPLDAATDENDVALLLGFGADPNLDFDGGLSPFATAALGPSRFWCAAAMLGRATADARMLRLAAERGNVQAAMIFAKAGARLDEACDGEPAVAYLSRMLGPETAAAIAENA